MQHMLHAVRARVLLGARAAHVARRSVSALAQLGARPASAALSCACARRRGAATSSVTAQPTASASAAASEQPQAFTQDIASRWHRSHGCGELRDAHEGAEVCLTGWLEQQRVLSHVIFAPMRDHSGRVQLVFEETDGAAKHVAAALARAGPESVIGVRGVVRKRPARDVRADQPTGAVEVVVRDVDVINAAEALPYPPYGALPSEETRFRHRYVDMRRAPVQSVLRTRSEMLLGARQFLHENGFIEVETPLLFRPTPEGAREFVVPTRQRGLFYALPQSPQQFKQILMSGGVPRYFQVAKCFRDEGGRADRQPEFTQLDMEMSFVSMHDVQDMSERVLQRLFELACGVRVPTPFPHMLFRDAMRLYGVDKPDKRFGMELVDLSDVVRTSGLGVHAVDNAFHGASGERLAKPALVGWRLPRAHVSQVDLPRLLELRGVQCMALRLGDDGKWKGAASKHILGDKHAQLAAAAAAEPGDMLLLKSGNAWDPFEEMGAVRLEVGRKLLADGALPAKRFQFLWVTDFPLFEFDKDTGVMKSTHHMFTAPHPDDVPLLVEDPARVRGLHYDVVLDGVELGGGSIRIHDPRLQQHVLDVLHIDAQPFDHLLRALRAGCPPHGGIAFGIDRLLAVALQLPSIRDVLAFPKLTSGYDAMTEAPFGVDDATLKEYHIELRQ